MDNSSGVVGLPPQRKGRSKKKIGGILTVVFLIGAFAVYTLNYNAQAGYLIPARGDSPSTPSEQVPLKPGRGTIVHEELDLTGMYEITLDIAEKTQIKLEAQFDSLVKLEMFAPFNSGKYVTEFSHIGWISEGLGDHHTLRITPETEAKGTIMITELNRL